MSETTSVHRVVRLKPRLHSLLSMDPAQFPPDKPELDRNYMTAEEAEIMKIYPYIEALIRDHVIIVNPDGSKIWSDTVYLTLIVSEPNVEIDDYPKVWTGLPVHVAIPSLDLRDESIELIPGVTTEVDTVLASQYSPKMYSSEAKDDVCDVCSKQSNCLIGGFYQYEDYHAVCMGCIDRLVSEHIRKLTIAKIKILNKRPVTPPDL
jgi:hypothetical protein